MKKLAFLLLLASATGNSQTVGQHWMWTASGPRWSTFSGSSFNGGTITGDLLIQKTLPVLTLEGNSSAGTQLTLKRTGASFPTTWNLYIPSSTTDLSFYNNTLGASSLNLKDDGSVQLPLLNATGIPYIGTSGTISENYVALNWTNATKILSIQSVASSPTFGLKVGSTTANAYGIFSFIESGATYYPIFIPGSAVTFPFIFYNTATTSSNAIAVRNQGGSFNYMKFYHNDTYGGIYTSAGYVSIWPAAVEKARFNTDGNLNLWNSAAVRSTQLSVLNAFGSSTDKNESMIEFGRATPGSIWGGVIGAQQLSGDYNYGSLKFLTKTTDIVKLQTKATILANGNFGIGDSTPNSMLTVGDADKFQVDLNGNVVKINNVTTSFPATQGNQGAVWTNDGAGNLTSWYGPEGFHIFEDWISYNGVGNEGYTSFNTATYGIVGQSTSFIDSSHFGILQLYTSGGTDPVYAGTTLGATRFMLNGGPILWEGTVRIPALSTASQRYFVLFGLVDDLSSTSGTNGAYFTYEDDVNTGKWQCVTKKSSTANARDAGVSVAANTWYKLRIFARYVGTTFTVTYYINGSQVAEETSTTYIPLGTGSGTVGALGVVLKLVKTVGTTATTIYVDYSLVDKKITLAR